MTEYHAQVILLILARERLTITPGPEGENATAGGRDDDDGPDEYEYAERGLRGE